MKCKAVKALQSLNVKNTNRLLLSLLKKYTSLPNDKNYEQKTGPVLIFLFESLGKNEDLDQASTKRVVENIVK